jgi:hypothetical protein
MAQLERRIQGWLASVFIAQMHHRCLWVAGFDMASFAGMLEAKQAAGELGGDVVDTLLVWGEC